MYKARNVIGLPVLDIGSGKRIGTVSDLLFDGERNIQAILLETSRWFESSRAIRRDRIVALGMDAVTVTGTDATEELKRSDGQFTLHHDPGALKGIPVITVNGSQLGTFEDVYFTDEMGMKIIGYELSDGFMSDIREGRKWLPHPDKVTFGEDAVIVPAESELHVQETTLSTEE